MKSYNNLYKNSYLYMNNIFKSFYLCKVWVISVLYFDICCILVYYAKIQYFLVCGLVFFFLRDNKDLKLVLSNECVMCNKVINIVHLICYI